MCNFEKGFILCTCKTENQTIIHNQHSRKHKKQEKNLPKGFRWILLKFVNQYESMMEGSYQMPSDSLGSGLDSDWILLNLNCEKCFDFDYTPQEGDNLIFRSDEKYLYMSFIYTKNEWIKDNYDNFSTILEKRFEGKIKEIN